MLIRFIHSIGKYVKHGTYIKWYTKELDKIKLFMKHKENTVENIIKDYDTDIKVLLTDYYHTLMEYK